MSLHTECMKLFEENESDYIIVRAVNWDSASYSTDIVQFYLINEKKLKWGI